jgi:DNA-binding MarR family transcriptional regulator/GNAT superfamily N-acetyltransferase
MSSRSPSPPLAPVPRAAVDGVRAFNRFYTRQMGLLGRGLLGSEFTLTESRVLYELAQRGHAAASELARDLDIDAGYLSRLLARFERRGQIRRTRSALDARRSRLELTRKGRTAFDRLDRAASGQVAAMIAPLSAQRRQQALSAMRGVQHVFAPPAAPGADAVRLRPLRVGDIGWITRRQGMLYAQEYGWDGTYEALVAQILSDFVKTFDAATESAWIAERDEEVVGSVFLVRATARLARLRLLYVEPQARGLGIGARLVAECIAFARARGYRRLTLWTNDILVAARRIYEAAGFVLVKSEAHHSFGKDLVGQTWELAL